MEEAVNDAKITLRRADSQTGAMARLVNDRLRNVSGNTLAEMKRQLRDFNINTYEWRK
jgi:hypothetical protein